MLPDGGIPEEDDDSGSAPGSAPDPSAQKQTIRRQLGEEFLEIIDDEPDEEAVDWALGSKFLETAEEMAYKESYAVSDDGIRHVVFETNHPDLDVADGDSSEMAVVHQIARFTR